MTIEQFSKDFPAVTRFTYLNTAGSGLLSEGLMEWRQNHDIDFLIGDSDFRLKANEYINSVREVVASYFQAENAETFLAPNFTLALKTIINGMEKDQKVLLLEEDYPSLSFPFRSGGFKEIDSLDISADVEAAIEERFKTNTPDIFAFSLIQYISGIRLDLDFLKRLKKEYPQVLFVADATQFSGIEVFSFKDSGIDIFGGSGYKWLLSGYGNAYLLIKKELQQKIYNNTLVLEPLEEPFLKTKTHLQLHLEAGHLDTLNIGSLGYSLELFTEIGQEQIQNHLRSLASYAKDGFQKLGCLSPEVGARKEIHSPIFNINISEKQGRVLEDHNIVFSYRGPGARFSFHLYNTTKDVDKLLKLLERSQK